ncbi:branched-chain amino acid aminotransferase [Desulfacinum hydrothermale DSM 13146]|uniref:branched-chain-amino-acid transaminase n=1 Tax=Desulfacinum hydrothermale DSM 13146 TaxID=1121390 RepID=A0A1W1X232_9BACT|nr:aminotransferase class IV [Desulfacinum hydrothermale]SMC18026.1 branched-chain amino acid aminotransferase [Desulfacinum hydrothermale DSM 13146]
MTDSPDRVVWLNGSFVAEADARISPLDRGFLYGDGLFETLRAQNGNVLYVADHLERLRKASGQLRLTPENAFPSLRDISRWRDLLENLLKKNGLTAGPARLRIQITRGRAMDLGLPTPASPTLLAMAAPYHPPTRRECESGWRLHLVKSPFTSALAAFKTCNYLLYLQARQMARDTGFHEALLTDPNGTLAETSTGSLIFLNEGVCTLSASPFRLPGTAEERIARMFSKDGWQVTRAAVTPGDLSSYEALWTTNSLMGVLPVRSVDDVALPRMFRRRADQYREHFFQAGTRL